MSEQPRDEFESSLWEAARRDAPSPASRQRALSAALGAPPPPPPGTPSPAPAAGVVKGIASKWLVLGALGAGVAAGLVVHSRGGRSTATATPTATPTSTTTTTATATPTTTATPTSTPTTTEAATPVAAKRTGEDKASTLAREIVAIDAARSALTTGSSAGALKALDAHDRAFPDGVLRPEATVLRIEALHAHGDTAAATALGRTFLATNPGSPLAARVRGILRSIDVE